MMILVKTVIWHIVLIMVIRIFLVIFNIFTIVIILVLFIIFIILHILLLLHFIIIFDIVIIFLYVKKKTPFLPSDPLSVFRAKTSGLFVPFSFYFLAFSFK